MKKTLSALVAVAVLSLGSAFAEETKAPAKPRPPRPPRRPDGHDGVHGVHVHHDDVQEEEQEEEDQDRSGGDDRCPRSGRSRRHEVSRKTVSSFRTPRPSRGVFSFSPASSGCEARATAPGCARIIDSRIEVEARGERLGAAFRRREASGRRTAARRCRRQRAGAIRMPAAGTTRASVRSTKRASAEVVAAGRPKKGTTTASGGRACWSARIPIAPPRRSTQDLAGRLALVRSHVFPVRSRKRRTSRSRSGLSSGRR